MAQAIGPVPTPFVPVNSNYNYTPQSTGGKVFNTTPAPYSSYNGASYGGNGQVVSTVANPMVATQRQSIPSNNTNTNKPVTPGNNYQPPSGQPQPVGTPTQPDYSQVDSAYNDAMGYANQMVNDLQGQKQNIFDQYTQPIDAMQPQIDQSRQTQTVQNQAQTQSAIDAAVRLYNDMLTRARQQFGGSNSAGEFAQQFYGRENQRQQGNIQNQSGQNQFSIESTYQKNMQDLANQRKQALTSAQADFNSRMEKINSAKFQFEQDRANARLAELQNYRNRVYSIEDAATQYQRQQELMRLQSGLNQSLSNNNSALSIGQYNPQFSGISPGPQAISNNTNITGNSGTQSPSVLDNLRKLIGQ